MCFEPYQLKFDSSKVADEQRYVTDRLNIPWAVGAPLTSPWRRLFVSPVSLALLGGTLLAVLFKLVDWTVELLCFSAQVRRNGMTEWGRPQCSLARWCLSALQEPHCRRAFRFAGMVLPSTSASGRRSPASKAKPDAIQSAAIKTPANFSEDRIANRLGYAARMISRSRRAPHVPGSESNRPGHGSPHSVQRPCASRPQSVMAYQSRPIRRKPQP